jgi:hypothetical protein
VFSKNVLRCYSQLFYKVKTFFLDCQINFVFFYSVSNKYIIVYQSYKNIVNFFVLSIPTDNYFSFLGIQGCKLSDLDIMSDDGRNITSL